MKNPPLKIKTEIHGVPTHDEPFTHTASVGCKCQPEVWDENLCRVVTHQPMHSTRDELTIELIHLK